MQHSMTSELLSSHKIVYALEALEKWISSTGLPDPIVDRVVRELGNELGLSDWELEQLLEVDN